MARPKNPNTPVKPPKSAADKSAAFVIKANARTNTAIARIEAIGKLGRSKNYIFTMPQVEKIFEALDNAVSEARDQFTTKPGAAKTSFSL